MLGISVCNSMAHVIKISLNVEDPPNLTALIVKEHSVTGLTLYRYIQMEKDFRMANLWSQHRQCVLPYFILLVEPTP